MGVVSNHPNRSAGRPARNPSPAEVRAAREAAGLTQEAAGELIHGSRRAWQDYESGARKMHPGLWELFQSKAQTSAPHYPACAEPASPSAGKG